MERAEAMAAVAMAVVRVGCQAVAAWGTVPLDGVGWLVEEPTARAVGSQAEERVSQVAAARRCR